MKTPPYYTVRISDKSGTIFLRADSMTQAKELLIEYLYDKDDVYGFEIKVREPI